MLTETLGCTLPFTSEQLFDVVADIERYPEFLPGWISASIYRREANTCYVEQVLGRGPVRVQFASKAVLQRPERLDITSSDAAFRLFSLCVLISPGVSAAECHFSLSAQVELRSLFLQTILGRLLASSIHDIIAAFEARAHRLYDRSQR
jgi:coenzyme Q-binding protein COQ10